MVGKGEKHEKGAFFSSFFSSFYSSCEGYRRKKSRGSLSFLFFFSLFLPPPSLPIGGLRAENDAAFFFFLFFSSPTFPLRAHEQTSTMRLRASFSSFLFSLFPSLQLRARQWRNLFFSFPFFLPFSSLPGQTAEPRYCGGKWLLRDVFSSPPLFSGADRDSETERQPTELRRR